MIEIMGMLVGMGIGAGYTVLMLGVVHILTSRG